MQIGEDIYNFLQVFNLINPTEGKKISDDKYSIGKNTTNQLENGQMFAKIIKQIAKIQAQAQKRPEQPFPDLDSLKEMNSPAARLYNWNVLQECFRRLQINLETETKSLIIAGDQDQLSDFIKDIITNVAVYMPELFGKNKGKSKVKQNEYKDEIEVAKVDINKDLTKCKSCLEFFVILLSRHLSLPPQQVQHLSLKKLQSSISFLNQIKTASLFTHNNKYLAHLFAKGVKGLFDPIIFFYQEVYQSIPLLLQLFLEDPTKKSMHFSMNCLKPGLVSKSYEVATWAARLFSKLALEFSESNLLTVSWDWFVGENGGLNTTLLGLKRHPDMKDLVVQILLQFARYNFVELFTIHMKKAQPDPKDLVGTYLVLLKPLTATPTACDEILNAGILDEWIDFALDGSTDEYKNTIDMRIVSLTLLVEVWMLFPFKIEDSEYKSNAVLQLLGKACKDKSQSLVICSLTLLFQLLIYFGNQKSQFAPNVYRTLTLSIIENHQNVIVREFIMNNFITVYETLESIPLNILIEPLVRQIQVTDNVSYFFNVFDFNFFAYISKNDKLQLKNAIQLLDLFFKIYLNNTIFANVSSVPILNIVNRFIDSETLQEFVIKFVKVALAMFYASEKKKRPKEKVMPLYNNKSAIGQPNLSPGEIEQELIQAQKRALIVEMIKSIVTINCYELNEKIKPLVAHTNIQIKQFTKQNNKGMQSILSLFGNPDTILEKYEKEYIEHQQQLKQEEKERREQEQDTLLQDFEGSPKNQGDVLKSIEDNLKKYGIGLKERQTKLTKAEATRLALLRNPKADPKILKKLQEIKVNYENREEKKKLEVVKQEQETQKEKEVLRKQLMRRSLEQGVSNFNQRDAEGVLLFQFGSREKQIKRENKTGLPLIQYIDLDKEEQRDKDTINVLLRRYNKILKNVFVKYSNTGFSAQFSNKNVNSFDAIKEHNSLISIPEMYRFVKDYELSDKLSKEEHQTLVRIVSQEQAKKKSKQEVTKDQPDLNKQLDQKKKLPATQSQQNMFLKGSNENKWNFNQNEVKDVKSFDFQGFLDYIVQFAGYIYSKPPEDLRHLPLSASLQKVFDHMREITKKKGQSTALFDDYDNLFFGETEVIKQFNKKLEENPDYPLPQGYKKVKEKEIKFEYALDPKGILPMKESFKYAYLVLNDLFQEQLKFSIIEPKSATKEVVKAQPLIGITSDVESHYFDMYKSPQVLEQKRIKKPQMVQSQSVDILGPWGKPDSTKTLPSTLNVKSKYGNQRVLDIDNYHKLDLGLKLAVSTIGYRDRYTAEQCAYCLDDIIKSIESGDSNQAFRNKKVENKVIKEKKKEEEAQEEAKKKYEEKRLKDHDFVMGRAKEIIEQNSEKDKQKKEKEQQLKKQKEEEQKKKADDMSSFWKEKKEVFDQQKQKLIEEQKRIQEEQIKRMQEEKEKKEKEFQEFNRKQIEKQQEEFKKQKEKEQQEAEKQKNLEEYQKKLKEKLHMHIVKTDQERIEIEKVSNVKIKELFQKEDVQGVYKTNEFKLSQLFFYLKKYTYREISRQNMSDNEISYKTFNWFCYRFNIYPEIISNPKDILLIYRSVTRNKQVVDHKPIGLSEEEFKEAMLRISIKGKKIFNKFSEQLQKGINLNESEMAKIADDENKEENQEEFQENKSVKSSKTEALERMKNVIDYYGNIDEANFHTLEALIYYLGLPNDKLGINEALKNVMEQGAVPDGKLKEAMKQKIVKDPNEILRYNPPQNKVKFGRSSQVGNNQSQMVNNSQVGSQSGLPDNQENQDQEENEQEQN
ncbi:hypothetical protein ABPG74_005580 [Tetrahymena malaccensis]